MASFHGADDRRLGCRARQVERELADRAVLRHHEGIERGRRAVEAHAVRFARTGRDTAKRSRLCGGGVKREQGDLRIERIVAVARRDDDPAVMFGQCDIVDPAGVVEVADLAVEAVNIEPGLLVGADDQAPRRFRCIAPDRGVVGRVGVRRSHCLGLRRCLDGYCR